MTATEPHSPDDSRKLRRTIQRLHAEYGEQINALTRDKAALYAEVGQLREDQAESEELRERMAQLLRGAADALKGDPGPLTSHDWSDLPEVAAAVVAGRVEAGLAAVESSPHWPDVKTLTPLETQHITAECRDNKTHYTAWEHAVHLLRHVYDAQVRYRPGVTVSVAIYVTSPEPPPGPPKPPRLPRGSQVA